MAKRILRACAALIFATCALVGVEIVLALRREYLPTEPALEIGGSFGESGPGVEQLRFVVLGDSTAAGVGAGSPENAYASLLAERLAATGRHVRLTALGMSGARIDDLLETQVPAVAGLEPDLVFVWIGANDVTHLTPLDDVRRDMGRLIDGLSDTGATLVVAGPPDMRAAAFYEPLRWLAGLRGRQVESAIDDVARERGVPVVQLAERTASYFGSDPDSHYSSDEFHPGPGGYRRWADAIFPVLEEALS